MALPSSGAFTADVMGLRDDCVGRRPRMLGRGTRSPATIAALTLGGSYLFCLLTSPSGRVGRSTPDGRGVGRLLHGRPRSLSSGMPCSERLLCNGLVWGLGVGGSPDSGASIVRG